MIGMQRLLCIALDILLLLLMLLPSQAKFSRKTKEQVFKRLQKKIARGKKVVLQNFFVTMLIRIVIVATMTIFLVMIITLSLRRKPNLKPFVGIETRESFFG